MSLMVFKILQGLLIRHDYLIVQKSASLSELTMAFKVVTSAGHSFVFRVEMEFLAKFFSTMSKSALLIKVKYAKNFEKIPFCHTCIFQLRCSSYTPRFCISSWSRSFFALEICLDRISRFLFIFFSINILMVRWGYLKSIFLLFILAVSQQVDCFSCE